MINTIFDILEKEDTAEKLLAVQDIDPKYILFAPEFNMLLKTIKKLIPKGKFSNNTEALNAGLVDGDIYYLPKENDRYVLAIVKEIPYITITDLNADIFDSLESAREFVTEYTNAEITNESFSNGIYKFSVPDNSTFDLNSSFCSSDDRGKNLEFIDLNGLVVNFGANSFLGNTQNNVFGNTHFADNSFTESIGNNTFKDVTFDSKCFYRAKGNNQFGNCVFGNNNFTNSEGNNSFGNVIANAGFFNASSGINKFNNITVGGKAFNETAGTYYFKNVDFKNEGNFNKSFGVYFFSGDLGENDSKNFMEDFFKISQNAVIHALAIKESSNDGDIEGDLMTAKQNEATIIFDL